MQKGIMASDRLSLHDWAGAHGVSEGRRKNEYKYSYSSLCITHQFNSGDSPLSISNHLSALSLTLLKKNFFMETAVYCNSFPRGFPFR